MSGLDDLFNAIIGSGINKKDSEGETRLLKAARQGSLKIVKKLLKDGANPDIPDSHGLTPLHHAAYWGETEIVKALLAAGANPKCDNGRGWTPLHSATISGGVKIRKDVIKLLKDAGGDDMAKDKHGWTPKDYIALWAKDAEAAEKMKSYVEIQGRKTPLERRREGRGPKAA